MDRPPVMILELPTERRAFRLSTEDVARLKRVAALLGQDQTSVLRIALLHLEHAVSRGEPVYLTPPPRPEDDLKTG